MKCFQLVKHTLLKKANQRFFVEKTICLDILYLKIFTLPSFEIAARRLTSLSFTKKYWNKSEQVPFIVVLPVHFGTQVISYIQKVIPKGNVIDVGMNFDTMLRNYFLRANLVLSYSFSWKISNPLLYFNEK